MTNQEYARILRATADWYEDQTEDGPSLGQRIYIHCWSKEDLLEQIQRIGGKWTKSFTGEEMRLTHADLMFLLVVPRDKVCKKTVTWDCEPLLTPTEITKIDEVIADDVEIPF